MIKNIRFIVTTSIIILFLITALIVIIITNSPYYTGFESRLDYLSSDLSEYRSISRDKVILRGESSIKLVFERKEKLLTYDTEQLNNFLKNLEVRIWRNSEYFEYKYEFTPWPGSGRKHVILELGTLEGNGEYTVYIKSDLGRNSAYHIGIGIGRGSDRTPISSNRRSFY